MNKRKLNLSIWLFLSLLIIFGGITAAVTKEITFLKTNKITRGDGAVYVGIIQSLIGIYFLATTFKKFRDTSAR